MEYPELIKTARIAAGLTQEELARLLGISRETMNAIENGYQECSVSRLQAISEVVQKPTCELTNGYKHR